MVVRVALIGAGIWVTEEHFPSIQASPDLELVAVYPQTLKLLERLVKEAGQVRVYADDAEQGGDELLKCSNIDATIVAIRSHLVLTAEPYHIPISKQACFIRAALAAGKHVLSEKPMSSTCRAARELMKWYRSTPRIRVTWCVAENWRFLKGLGCAREQVSKAGRILGFRVRAYDNIQPGWRYRTIWRQHPEHQGGFLLDSGVHYTGGLRLLLGQEKITSVVAFTTLLREHLSPVDTLDAIIKTESRIQGVFQFSVGTTLSGDEWTIACERGTITAGGPSVPVTARIDGKEEMWDIQDQRTGVPTEVAAWGRALAAGKPDLRHCPEKALADLELAELMLESGRNGGKPVLCNYQQVA